METGLSDFHKMTVAVMKMHFPKMKPQVVSYRKYKDFNNETLLDSLTLFRIRGRGAKRPPTNFSPATSTNAGISPQNFLTFSFNPFGTLA